MKGTIKAISIGAEGDITYAVKTMCGVYPNPEKQIIAIEPFLMNGEMAHVQWYRIVIEGGETIAEINGKFVNSIFY